MTIVVDVVLVVDELVLELLDEDELVELVELVVEDAIVLVTMLLVVVVELLDDVVELLVDVLVLVVLSVLDEVLDVLLLVVVGSAPQRTSACDREMNSSASGSPLRRSKIDTCSAETVTSAMLPATTTDCSLMTIWPIPSGNGTTWFGTPVTVIAMPFTTSPTTVEETLPEASSPVQVAVACDVTTLTWMLARPIVSERSSTLASEVLELPVPSVVASSVSAEMSPRRLKVCSPALNGPPPDG